MGEGWGLVSAHRLQFLRDAPVVGALRLHDRWLCSSLLGALRLHLRHVRRERARDRGLRVCATRARPLATRNANSLARTRPGGLEACYRQRGAQAMLTQTRNGLLAKVGKSIRRIEVRPGESAKDSWRRGHTFLISRKKLRSRSTTLELIDDEILLELSHEKPVPHRRRRQP